MKMQKGQLKAVREAQFNAFHKDEPGSWFTMFSGLLADHVQHASKDDGILSINLGNGAPRVFGLDGEAVAIYDRVKKQVEVEGGKFETQDVLQFSGYKESKHRGWSPHLLDRVIPGCVPCVGTLLGARIGAGVLVVVGKGDSSKTPFAYAIAEEIGGEDGYEVIRLGEPLSGYNTDLETATDDIVKAIISSRVIVMDSIKDVLGTAGGNATSSGLSRGAFQFISDLGTIAASRGCIIIIPVNPSSADTKVADLLTEAAKSNATMVAIGADRNWEVLGRTGEGLLRTKTAVIGEFAKGSLVMTLSVPGSATKAGQTVKDVAVTTAVSSAEYESIINRLSRTV